MMSRITRLSLCRFYEENDDDGVIRVFMQTLIRVFRSDLTRQSNNSRTLIEAAKTMLADSLLPIPFWAEAVNTACYVQNRVLVTKPHNKTPYELLHGRTPSIGFMRPFGCPVTILNTLDPLGKFKGKVDEGFLVGYSVDSKAFRVFNSRNWNQTNPSAGFQDKFDAQKAMEEGDQHYVLFPIWSSGSTNPQNNEEDAAFDKKEHDFDAKKPESAATLSPSSSAQSRKQDDKTKKEAKGKTPVESVIGYRDLNAEFEDCSDNSCNEVNAVEADFNNLETSFVVSPIPTTRIHKDHPVSQIIGDLSSTTQTRSMTRVVKDQGRASSVQDAKSLGLVDLPHGKRAIGTKWVYRNKKDERDIVIRNKARLVAQGHTQEERIDYEEVFAPVTRIEAIRLFLAYASFMGFMVYQMDVKSAFLYRTIEEEVYVCQPSGFEDPDHPDKVYKVVKALYGLHQALRAWSMIGSLMYLTSSRPDIMFAVCACARFQVTPKDSHLHAVKRIFTYLKGKLQLGLWYPKDSPFDLVAYSDSDYAGASLDRKSTSGGCQFLGCRLISWQCKKQTVIATSSTETEYVAATRQTTSGKEISNPFMDVAIKQINDVTILQALVDKKKVVITEATIREVLRLDDAEGVNCLPNEEIFAELARMGKGFLGVETPLFKGMIVEQVIEEGGAEEEHVEDNSATQGDATTVQRDAAQEPSIPSPTPLTQQPQDIPSTSQRIDTSEDTVMKDASNQRRMVDDLDKDDTVTLTDDKEEDKQEAKVVKDDQVVDIVTTAKLITEVGTAASTTIFAAEPQVPAATITDASIRVAAASTRRRKGVVIRDPKEESTTIIPADTKSKDKGKGIMIEESKPLKKKQQVEMDEEYARKLHAELNKDIDWDVAIDH
uniref:Reverse transcriptase Ty1/copia-type domain-containing protein n=1 Tax=Tanacetum cinerariifolium TaxID=118510 RepID=A0A6L2JFC0_TANCI|nr:hypothetical protein [Tanacetum cinerariifolium]